MSTNEAAERMRNESWIDADFRFCVVPLQEALAELAAAKAEGAREAIVRAKDVLDQHGWLRQVPKEHDGWRSGESWILHVARHLDEEAAR